MKKNKLLKNERVGKSKVPAFLLAVLFASSVLAVPSLVYRSTAQTVEPQSFAVINSIWGTTTSTYQAGPGDQDVPLTVTLQYLYSFPSVSTEFEITLPAGITSTSSSRTGQDINNATAYYVNRLEQGQIFQITLYLDLANSTQLGEYTMPTTILWYAILSNSTNQPEVYLEQDLNLVVNLNGNSNLQFSANDTALIPDKINDIGLTLENSGSGNVSEISTTVSVSSLSASILNQLPTDQSLGPNSNLSEMLSVFVPQSAAGSIFTLTFSTTYLDPYQNQQSITQSLGFFVSSLGIQSPLSFTIGQTSLVPGGINNLTMAVTNGGASAISNISTVLSAPATSAEATGPGISIVSQPAIINSLAAGASTQLSFGVFASSSAAGTPIELAATTNYITAAGLGQSVSNSFGLYVSTQAMVSSPAISVSELSDYVTTGVPSKIALMINNTGLQPIYNPTFSLATTTPLFVSANSTFSLAGSSINPGNGVLYESVISSGPSATIGVYGGTLTVSFTNEYGVSSTETAQVSFTLAGKILMVIQGEVITQSSASNLTVSGTLLNEGTVDAYYATAIGSVDGAAGNDAYSSYIGEVDVNTPVPFTVTVPYTAGSSPSNANVSIQITFQDGYGRNLTYASSMPTNLLSASQLEQQSSATQTATVTGTRVGSGGLIILILIIIIIVLGVFAFRRRSSGKNSKKKSNVI